MEQPLVSVMMPVYNAKLHIARCVESIRKQSYQNLEIILVNDGSSDVTCRWWICTPGWTKRILLIDKANSGVSATRNLAISMATGKYLQFADSDDYLAPDATRLLVEKAEQHTADLVIAPYYRVENHKPLFAKTEEDSYQTIEQYGFLDAGFYDKTAFAKGLMKEPASFYYGVMWNKLYRRDIVQNHNIQCNVELGWRTCCSTWSTSATPPVSMRWSSRCTATCRTPEHHRHPAGAAQHHEDALHQGQPVCLLQKAL